MATKAEQFKAREAIKASKKARTGDDVEAPAVKRATKSVASRGAGTAVKKTTGTKSRATPDDKPLTRNATAVEKKSASEGPNPRKVPATKVAAKKKTATAEPHNEVPRVDGRGGPKLESSTGRPSRKSTRTTEGGIKSGQKQQRQAAQQTRSPKARATRAKAGRAPSAP